MSHQRNQNVNGEGESVRLTRKFAERIDGVDLSQYVVGDTISLSHHDADLLVAEGWGERVVAGATRRPAVRRPAK